MNSNKVRVQRSQIVFLISWMRIHGGVYDYSKLHNLNVLLNGRITSHEH